MNCFIKQYSHCIIHFLKTLSLPHFWEERGGKEEIKITSIFRKKKFLCLRNLLNLPHWRVLYEGQGTLPLDFAVCIYWEALCVGSWAAVTSRSAASGVSGRSRWRVSFPAPVSGQSGPSHSVSERPLCPSIQGDLLPKKKQFEKYIVHWQWNTFNFRFISPKLSKYIGTGR